MFTTIIAIAAFLGGVYLGPTARSMVKSTVDTVKGWF